MSDPCDASLLSISEFDLGECRRGDSDLAAEPQPEAAKAWSPRPEDDAGDQKDSARAGRPWFPSVGLPWKSAKAPEGLTVETTQVTEVSQLSERDDGASPDVPVTPIGICGGGRSARTATPHAGGFPGEPAEMCLMPGALPSPQGSEVGLAGLPGPGLSSPGPSRTGSCAGGAPARGSAFGGPEPAGSQAEPTIDGGGEAEATPVSAFEAPGSP